MTDGLSSAGDGQRAVVIHPDLPLAPGDVAAAAAAARHPEARLEEAIGLAAAIDLETVHGEVVRVPKPAPATLVTGGVIDRLKGLIAHHEPSVVVVDAALTPVQQRNLERAWEAKVIDRTGLILEIFGARARTAEGKLQVELAALSFQRSRLVRSWTHLERQRGGFGFLGGPGESQLEIDRRLIGERIARIRKDLEKVKRTRGLHRNARRRVPYPVVALVGYTNAGKSTLFNRLTAAHVQAEDLLFATLDPTLRSIRLPSGRPAILADTVGFISDLPTQLVAAFRATLEEVLEADLILHVRDIAHPDSEAQRADVVSVLSDLGVEADAPADDAAPVIEVLNKIDCLDEDERAIIDSPRARRQGVLAISALTGDGTDAMLAAVDEALGAARLAFRIRLDITDGRALAWLYRHGVVTERSDEEAGVFVDVSLDPAEAARFTREFPYPLGEPEGGGMDQAAAGAG